MLGAYCARARYCSSVRIRRFAGWRLQKYLQSARCFELTRSTSPPTGLGGPSQDRISGPCQRARLHQLEIFRCLSLLARSSRAALGRRLVGNTASNPLAIPRCCREGRRPYPFWLETRLPRALARARPAPPRRAGPRLRPSAPCLATTRTYAPHAGGSSARHHASLSSAATRTTRTACRWP